MSISLDPKDELPLGGQTLLRGEFCSVPCLHRNQPALIAYAALGLGVTVPTCLPNGEVFNHGSVTRLGAKELRTSLSREDVGIRATRVRIPVGSNSGCLCNQQDVTHGLQITGTNVNLMAVPNAITNARVHFDKSGIFPIVCHEYCGASHQKMNAVIEVSNQVDDISAEGLPAQAGKAVAEDKGCLGCHSEDGSTGVGPTFKGIWGTTVQLADGSNRVVDADFVKGMILHPTATPVKGFEPVMPEVPVNDEEIDQIIEYLKGLK